MQKHAKSCKKDKRKRAIKSESDASDDDDDEDENVPLIALKRNESGNDRYKKKKN